MSVRNAATTGRLISFPKSEKSPSVTTVSWTARPPPPTPHWNGSGSRCTRACGQRSDDGPAAFWQQLPADRGTDVGLAAHGERSDDRCSCRRISSSRRLHRLRARQRRPRSGRPPISVAFLGDSLRDEGGVVARDVGRDSRSRTPLESVLASAALRSTLPRRGRYRRGALAGPTSSGPPPCQPPSGSRPGCTPRSRFRSGRRWS